MILIKQVIKYYLGLISHQHTTMVLVKVIPFICLKMTYPLSLFSIVVEQTLFFPQLSACTLLRETVIAGQ